MQRQAGTSRVAELPQSSQPRPQLFSSPKGKAEETDDLPVYKRNSAVAMKENFKYRLQEKLVHLIPVVVILCFFILWWFSYPVKLDSKDGWITTAYRLMAHNATFFRLTFPPYSSISRVQFLRNDSFAE